MDLRQIGYFLGLADELHFWRASARLNITQSALSRHIKALEDELGVLLFERNKRNVHLTTAGAFLRDEWQRLLPAIDNLNRHARLLAVGEAGMVRIGHPGSVTHSLIPELMASLSRSYPQLRVELQEIIVMKNAANLLNYEVDVLFTRIPVAHPALASQFLTSEPFALVVPDNHAVTAENFTNLGDVRNEKFILPPFQPNNQYTDLLSAIFKQYGYAPTVSIESDYGSIILSLVANGVGISVMPISYAIQSVPGVRFIRLAYQSAIHLVWRKNDVNPVIGNLLRVITET